MVQLAFSSTHHGDQSRVMWLDPTMTDEVNRVAEDAITAIDELLGPGAREHLLAALAKRVLADRRRTHDEPERDEASVGGMP